MSEREDESAVVIPYGCPDPKLVARLEAAEALRKAAKAAREVMTAVFSLRRDGPGRQAYDKLGAALSAWEAAGREERGESE
jgi:hypothetical protein